MNIYRFLIMLNVAALVGYGIAMFGLNYEPTSTAWYAIIMNAFSVIVNMLGEMRSEKNNDR